MRYVFTFALLAILICISSTPESARAQEYLTPGWKGTFTDYDRAVDKMFAEAHEKNVMLRVLVHWPYSGESVMGLRKIEEEYQLFLLEPEYVSLSHVSSHDVSCFAKLGLPFSKTIDRTCREDNYDQIDTLTMRRRTLTIDPASAYLMRSIWTEMIYRSRYTKPEYIILHGTVYHYTADGITAHVHSPHDGMPETFTDNMHLFMKSLRSDDGIIRDSLLNTAIVDMHTLYKHMMDENDGITNRLNPKSMLKGCDSTFLEIISSDYCWQTQLTSDGTTNLLIANAQDDYYKYDLLVTDGNKIISRASVLPVVDHYGVFNTMRGSYTYGYSELYPWEIRDFRTNRAYKSYNMFGYITDFKLIKSHYGIENVDAIILFDAILPSRMQGKFIEVEGKERWFAVDQLFQKK